MLQLVGVAPARASGPPLDPTLADASRRQHEALLHAVEEATSGWPAADRTLAAAMFDVLWSVGAYERLVVDWQLDGDEAIRGITWLMSLLEDAITEGRRPSPPLTDAQSGSIGGSRRARRSSSPIALVSDLRVAEEAVEHERAAHVAVERVLGGEADAGEHLLAVPGDQPGAAPGDGLGDRGRERRAVVPRRAPRRRRRPRWRRGCRPAGGARPGSRRWAGRTGCARGRASRASSSIVRDAPTSSWARARWPAATASAQSPAPPTPSTPPTGTSTSPSAGSSPATGRSSSVVRAATARGQRRAPSPTRSIAAVASPRSTAAPVRRAAGAPPPPAVGRRRRGRSPARRRAPTTSMPAAPWCSNSSDTAVRRSSASASCQPRSVEGGVEVARRTPSRWRGGCSARRARAPRRPSSVGPEVEQAAGDDVALDLGAAAVDRGGPGVEVLRAPPLARRRRRRAARSSARPSSGEVEHRLLGGGEQDLVDRGLRARACRRRPCGAGWRATGPGRRTAAGTPRPPRRRRPRPRAPARAAARARRCR